MPEITDPEELELFELFQEAGAAANVALQRYIDSAEEIGSGPNKGNFSVNPALAEAYVAAEQKRDDALHAWQDYVNERDRQD